MCPVWPLWRRWGFFFPPPQRAATTILKWSDNMAACGNCNPLAVTSPHESAPPTATWREMKPTRPPLCLLMPYMQFAASHIPQVSHWCLSSVTCTQMTLWTISSYYIVVWLTTTSNPIIEEEINQFQSFSPCVAFYGQQWAALNRIMKSKGAFGYFTQRP